MDLREIGWQIVDRMHLVDDKDQWRDFVNTVIKLWGSIGEEFINYLNDH
jgi:hypothetical protein